MNSERLGEAHCADISTKCYLGEYLGKRSLDVLCVSTTTNVDSTSSVTEHHRRTLEFHER
ncbi:hypothetical protein WN51_02920 [Melipona quadrifasciata]|uniref:Uncharacterized protein n=1 Tax=Melipona quadrifasciata TaxID=166423 RepID=A0A0N0BJU5_9HYME|nr:hypothetical protein WN51_02920 [Melipona quadrifasciata]